MGRAPLLLGHWHPADSVKIDDAGMPGRASPDGDAPEPVSDPAWADPPFATHLHGRELVVVHEGPPSHWHWRVASPHGAVLAEGDAPTRDAAEQAAEDEATAVHPPSDTLLDRLLS